MVKNKPKNAGNGVTQNGPAANKPPVQKRHVKTQTSRDFASQITKAELISELTEIEGLEMKGLVAEYNGCKVRRPRPPTRDAMTMTSRDASTQIKRETLLAVRQEVKQRGQSQVGPLVVAFKPKKRRPQYQRPKPPQRSIKTQTSRDFGSQVTAAEITETVETAGVYMLHAVPNEYEKVELTVGEQPTENGDEEGIINEEWTLEIVDDAGMNATIVRDEESETLVQNGGTNAMTSGVENPGFQRDVNEVSTEMATLTVEDDEDSEEEYNTYL